MTHNQNENPTQPRILSIGEALFDELEGGERHLGGAPLNLALHAAQLGAEAELWSAVGLDELGEELLAELSSRGVSVELVTQHRARETGRVMVRLDAETGEASYQIKEGVAWDELEWPEALPARLAELDALCFGSLCLRGAHNLSTLKALWLQLERRVERKERAPLCFFDMNLRPPFVDWTCIEDCLEAADALKVNREEWGALCQRALREAVASEDREGRALSEAQLERAQARAMMARFNLRWLVITKGAEGLTLHHREGVEQAREPALEPEQLKAGDSVGAGDATSAALLVSLLSGASWAESAQFAARCGAFVASQRGATPEFPEELRRGP